MKQRSPIRVWFPFVAINLVGLGLTTDLSAVSKDLSLRRQLQVFVYSYALLSSEDLKIAEKVAANIYEKIGITVGWVDCSPAEGDLKYNSACGLLTPATLVLRILPRSQAECFQQSRLALGFAQLDQAGGFGHFASVFYHRVEELCSIWTCSRPVLLGHIIAHELGHLLLGYGSHSPTGLMMANWDRRELERVNQRAFIFNSRQEKEIRARFLERHNSAEAARLNQFAEKLQVGGAVMSGLRSSNSHD